MQTRKQFQVALRAVTVILTLAVAGCGKPNPDITYANGVAAFSSGDYKTARKHFKNYAKLKPQSEIAAYNLGMTHFRLGEYKAAIEAFERASALSKDDDELSAEALVALAQTYRLAGKPDLALEAYGRAEKRVNCTPVILTGMALCHIEKKKFGLAEKCLTDALKYNIGIGGNASVAEYPAALFNLGVLFTKPAYSDPPKAAFYLYRFLRYNRNNPEFAAETAHAAKLMADLHRTATPDLKKKVLNKIVEAESFTRNPLKRFNTTREALEIYYANQDAMTMCIRRATDAGGKDAAEAKEMQAVLDLIKKY